MMTPIKVKQEVYTSGQVSKICQVAARTVSKWFDSGMLGGFRIPGSRDRRVPKSELIRFLRENDMGWWLSRVPNAWEITMVGLTVQMSGVLNSLLGVTLRMGEVADLFLLGMNLGSIGPVAIIDSCSLGKTDALKGCWELLSRGVEVSLLVGEDVCCTDMEVAGWKGKAKLVKFQHPVDPIELANHLRSHFDLRKTKDVEGIPLLGRNGEVRRNKAGEWSVVTEQCSEESTTQTVPDPEFVV